MRNRNPCSSRTSAWRWSDPPPAMACRSRARSPWRPPPRLQAQVAQSGVVLGSGARRAPVILAIGFGDGNVVEAADAPAHQPAGIALPVLVAVGAEPVSRVVVPLVGETHRDAVLAARPDFLDEPVVELAAPLAAQELLDGRAPVQKLG